MLMTRDFITVTRCVQLTVAAVALLSLMACESPINGRGDALMPRERFPITVSAEQAELAIPAPRAKTMLSRNEIAAIDDFFRRYRAIGHGPLTVSVPNTQAANTLLAEIDGALIAAGLPAHGLSARSYEPAEGDDAPEIRLSFTRYSATPSPCGKWNGSYAFAPTNEPTANFGCASQNNLAVMIQDPLDLIRPRTMDPADAGRRSVVLDNYRNGEPTGTERSDDEDGSVSEVNQN